MVRAIDRVCRVCAVVSSCECDVLVVVSVQFVCEVRGLCTAIPYIIFYVEQCLNRAQAK